MASVGVGVGVDITKFLTGKKDVIIVSDIEGFCAKEQIAKIVEYASSNDRFKGVIFNGDTLDYTVGIETLGVAHKDNLCALKLLKVLTDGMRAGNVICNIGNRDLNKSKLLALLQAADNSKWWESGKSIPEIAENLIKKYHTHPNATSFWKFEDLRSINPFWSKANAYFNNDRWLPTTPVIAESLLARFEYIFGDDPKVGTISAKNNLYGIPQELGITTNTKIFDDMKAKKIANNIEYNIENIETRLKQTQAYKDNDKVLITIFAKDTNDVNQSNTDDNLMKNIKEKEYQAAIVLTTFARMLFMDANPSHTPKLEQDGLLREYLTLANAVSYAILDKNLLLFAHGGFTTKFFEKGNENIIEDLQAKIRDKRLNIDSAIMTPKPQSGGVFISKMEQINQFNFEVKGLIKDLFKPNPATDEYIRKNESDIPFLNDSLMILTMLSTPATNNNNIKSLVSPYETALSPIQASTPIDETLYKSIVAEEGKAEQGTAEQRTTDVVNVINIFSHIPKGFGYSFGKSGDNSYFINTDFSNTLLKNRKYLNPIDTNSSYLLLHINYDPNEWKFKLEGTITLNTKDFTKSTIPTVQIADKIEEFNGKEYITGIEKKDTIITDDKSIFEDTIIIVFNQSFTLENISENCYETKNLFYHGVATVATVATSNGGEKLYKIYSVNGGPLTNFAKQLIILSLNAIEGPKAKLGLKGGTRRKTKKNISRKTKRLMIKNKSKRLNTRTQRK